MPDKNDFSELIVDLLRAQDRTNEKLEKIDTSMEAMRRENKENSDRMIAAIDRFATTVVDHLQDMRTELRKLSNMDERIKRLEAEVFKK
jgi:hypothetical protein